MSKNIIVINGHPDPESLNQALANAYVKGAQAGGHQVEIIDLHALDFQLNLQYGYRQRVELEADLLAAQEKIKAADHLVWIFPVWWGSVPALLKGFLDRAFLPGFAFQKREGSLWWDKLLKGKSARIVSTLDQPTWYYRWFNGRPTYHAMKKMTMQFCGVKRVGHTALGPVRGSTDAKRSKWLQKMDRLGRVGK